MFTGRFTVPSGVRKNFLCSVPNDAAPYEFVNNTAFQPIEAPLQGGSDIQNITFELRTDIDQALQIVPGAKTDFGVFCGIYEIVI